MSIKYLIFCLFAVNPNDNYHLPHLLQTILNPTFCYIDKRARFAL